MLNDLRVALRSLAKSPSFVAVSVLTLALGIGVNAAMFGVVNALLIRGLPFPAQERIFSVVSRNLEFGGTMDVSHADLADFRAEQRTFEDLAGYTKETFNLAGPGADPERVQGVLFSPSGPVLLRVQPALGRWFRPEEGQRGAAPVIVLGYALWQNRFGASGAVLGQAVKVNGEWATIVGVAPKNFRFPSVGDAWMPLKLKTDDARDNRPLSVFGRLKDGVTPTAAQAEFSAIAQRLAAGHQDTNKNVGATIDLLFHGFLAADTRQLVRIMFGAVGLVLLIACTNVANLLLARAVVRQKEIAVRAALGATRSQIVRLLLTETGVLSIAGAALGLPLAYGLMAALNAELQTKVVPYWMVFDIDRTGLGYISLLAIVTCLAAGLWPAWRMSRANLNAVLKDGGRGATGFALSRFTRAMVVGEVILSAVLLVLSALTIRSVVNAQTAPLGYRTAGVFTNRIVLAGAGYDDLAKRQDFFRELMRRLEARPEVEHVGVATLQPTWGDREPVEIEDRPRGGPNVSQLPEQFASRSAVSGSYFDTLGIKLLAGRTFDERDAHGALRVAIVSVKLAERLWPRENPLGKRFVYGSNLNVKADEWRTVIGVVSPTLQGEFQRDLVDVPQTYEAFTQWDDVRALTVFTRARGGGDTSAVANVVRATVRTLDADQPIYWPQTLEAMVADAWFFKGLIAWIFGIFGGLALVLAGIGLYGVMSYSVSQRTQEIGVRMALGAAPRDVVAMILREGGLRLGVGLLIGLGVAFLAGKLLAFILYGVEPGDPVSFVGTLLALGLAGFVACLAPALRAIRISPVEALRQE